PEEDETDGARLRKVGRWRSRPATSRGAGTAGRPAAAAVAERAVRGRGGRQRGLHRLRGDRAALSGRGGDRSWCSDEREHRDRQQHGEPHGQPAAKASWKVRKSKKSRLPLRSKSARRSPAAKRSWNSRKSKKSS